MIITVPEYKKIQHISKKPSKLNESLFDDDFDDDFDDETGILSSNISAEYEETELKPRVERILDELDVENYEIKCTGNGILVDVHDNLYLPNKGLNKFDSYLFHFDVVEGSCNYTGNNLTDWSFFPYVIMGNCYANFNNLKNFNGVPVIKGKLIANKQNKKPNYPLTQINYDNFKNKNITENSVYAIPVDRFGLLCSINEDNNFCIIQFDDNSKHKFKLNEVEYLGKLETLLI